MFPHNQQKFHTYLHIKDMENNKKQVTIDFQSIIEQFEDALGKFDPNLDLKNTPERLGRMFLDELLVGYKQDPNKILSKQFKGKSNDMVIIKDIPFVSLCAHHWLPFMGNVHIGYIPKKEKIVGLSKIPRLVKCFAQRFQIQENMTNEIANSLQNSTLEPEGCIIVVKAQHLCAQIRGVQAHKTEMICSAIRGCFENQEIKNEFFKLIE